MRQQLVTYFQFTGRHLYISHRSQKSFISTAVSLHRLANLQPMFLYNFVSLYIVIYIAEATMTYKYTIYSTSCMSSFLENPFRLYSKSACSNTKLQGVADRNISENLPCHESIFHAEHPWKTLRTSLENRRDFEVSRGRRPAKGLKLLDFVVPDSARSLMKHQARALGGAEMAGSSS
jgi:hypothetical protein